MERDLAEQIILLENTRIKTLRPLLVQLNKLNKIKLSVLDQIEHIESMHIDQVDKLLNEDIK